MAKGRKKAEEKQEQEQQTQEQEQQTQEQEGPTEEDLEAQRKEEFETAVEEARTDMQGSMTTTMQKHEVAVLANSKYQGERTTWENRNGKSIESRKAAQVRLSAARTALLNDWNERNGDATELETVGEGEEARAYLPALNFGFDEHADTEDAATEIEKEYWLASQSFNRISQSIAREPENLATLRDAADEAKADYDRAKAVYDEAMRRVMTS